MGNRVLHWNTHEKDRVKLFPKHSPKLSSDVFLKLSTKLFLQLSLKLFLKLSFKFSSERTSNRTLRELFVKLRSGLVQVWFSLQLKQVVLLQSQAQ